MSAISSGQRAAGHRLDVIQNLGHAVTGSVFS